MTTCCHTSYFILFFSWLLSLPMMSSLAQQVKRPPIIGIAYVELQVSDIEKAGIFYNSMLGYSIEPAGTMAGNGHRAFHISINQRQSIQIQDGLPATKDERLVCLAFQTTDAAALHRYLQSRAVAVPPSVTREGDMLSFTVTDPDRHTLKFVQYLANSKAQPQQKMAVSRRILHAGLTIANTPAADSFYAGVLGFSEIWRGGSTDSITSWINMRVPEGTDYLEYMLVSGPVNRQQLGGMHHIALMVPDMQEALDTLNGRAAHSGYEMAAPRIGRNKKWQLNLFDPDGTRIELMEPFPMR